METKFALAQFKTDNIKKDKSLKISSHFIFAEKKKNSFFKHILQKWITLAQELALKAEVDEINHVLGKHLSPSFVKIRKKYIQELEKICSREFNDKVVSNVFENAKIWQKKRFIIKKSSFNYFLRIIFPLEEIKKKFRSFGVLNKIVSRPVGLLKLTLMSVYEIIN